MIKPFVPEKNLLEIMPYLLDAFGNSTRIDYGSGNLIFLILIFFFLILGHEACFLIFLFCLYELEVFHSPEDDKAIILRVFRRYC